MEDPHLRAAMAFPVTASLGPVGPLLRQLRSPTSRPEVVSEDEIQKLTKHLDELCVSLMHQSEAEEPSATAKCWMREVRELCYDTKNYLDDASFISKQDGDAKLTPEEKQENAQFEFKMLEARAKNASKRRPRYEIEHKSINKTRLPSTRHRLPVLHPELIDRGRMDKLANMLRKDEEKQLKVVSLVGLEGVGKTTLAKRIYHQTGGQFDCRAFVRVSPNPDMRRLLTSIFTQIQLPGFSSSQPVSCFDAQDLIKYIEDYLRDKRYLIIIDDLWSTSVWDIIMRAFPDGGCHSRIITITQFDDVASACCSYRSKYKLDMKPFKYDQSRKLFFGMVFGSEDKVSFPEGFREVSYEIIEKCGGLPLSMVNIASLLPTEESEINLQEWKDIRDSLPPTLKTNPTSEGLEKVINLIYNNLSPEMKTCLLYLAVYPEGYTSNKYDLVKQWVTEGFTGEGQNKDETAREYFDVLVSSGMIQPVDTNYSGVLSCTLHHMVHDLIVKKSMEGNFIIGVHNFQSAIWLPNKVRRLSIQFGGARSARIPSGITLSEVRSLAFFGFYECTDFIKQCKLLRVLILDVWADQDKVPFDLSGICKQLQLRYVKIACNIAVKLPDKIRALRCLETLEVDATVVAIPSDIGRLRRLSSLKITVRVLSMEDIRILQALPALAALSLHVWTMPVEMIVFHKEGFSVLKYFKFSCPVPRLKFEGGSMADLQNLDICFKTPEADQRDTVSIIIEHLPGLKHITAHIWGADNFRTGITNHPSNPGIEIQLVDRSFPYVAATDMGKGAKEYTSKDEGKEHHEKKQAADSRSKRTSTSRVPVVLEGSSSLVFMQGLKRANETTPPAPSMISHPAHPQHRLTLVPTGLTKYKCDGCREHGTGADRYTCKPCGFDLHTDCALADGTTLVHPLLPKSTFELRREPPRSKARCRACGARVQGIHYHCGLKDLCLHPCCGKLPMRISLGDELTFELREEVSHCCSKCRKGGGVRDYWFYRSTCQTVYLHVGCVKDDFLMPDSSTESDVKETALRNHGSVKAGKNADTVSISQIVKALASIILAVITGKSGS
ncbi:hypothetical protein ACQJBY_025849 [Aegilops geniculata]